MRLPGASTRPGGTGRCPAFLISTRPATTRWCIRSLWQKRRCRFALSGRRTGSVMETWQEVLKSNSIRSLEALAAKFGPEHFPDLDRLRQAAENFEFRISPAMVDLIKSPDDPIWRQYVPSVDELDVVDGIVDSLNEEA